MDELETASAWERVAELKPRLRAHTTICRHSYRGEPWYILQDRVSGRYFRFGLNAHAFIEQLDGQRSIKDIHHALTEQLGEVAPTEDEVVELLAQLHTGDMLQGDMNASGAELFARREQLKKLQWRQKFLRPLALRFPLADPDRLLNKLLPYISRIFNRTGMFIWCAVILIGLLMVPNEWPALTAHWHSRALDPLNLLLMLLIYPVIKILHEFGHASATKVWGGEVHEMGLMLLVLMPIPYVDASAAHAFSHKWRRVIVGASGIMVEMFLAALALILWVNLQPGLLRDIAFNVMLIGSVSTLLFNGNPLLRFDGYYVLADAVEIPNLGTRANRYLGYLLKRYVYGINSERSPVTATGERRWLFFYGVASFIYRLFIIFVIALFIAGKFFVIGVLLALWALVGQLLLPLFKNLKFLIADSALEGHRRRAIIGTSAALLCSLALVFVVPVPSWTRAEGILALPEHSQLRAANEGFITQVLGKEDQSVKAGSILFTTDDPLLTAQRSILELNLKELKVRQTSEFMQDRSKVGIIKEQINAVQAELADIQQQMEQQIVVSPIDGVFVVSRPDDLLGRFVKKGDLLGHVADLSAITAQVVVAQQDANLVRQQTKNVEIRFPHRPGESVQGHILREVPLISGQLPSRSLGTQGGGAIAVDARDSKGLQTIDKVYLLDIALPTNTVQGYLGSKVYVRFNHSAQPLGLQILRSLRQLFLARFEV